MTGIVIALRKSDALIATDSVAVDEKGNPVAYTTKAHYIPRSNLAIVSTGDHGLFNEWKHFVEFETKASIEQLDPLAPQHLRRIRETAFIENRKPKPLQIIHIGFRAGANELVCFTYDSDADFCSRRIRVPGYFASPDLDIRPPFDPLYMALNGLRKQQAVNRQKGRPHNIGGPVVLLYLRPHEASYRVLPKALEDADEIQRLIEAAQDERRDRLAKVPATWQYRLKLWLKSHE